MTLFYGKMNSSVDEIYIVTDNTSIKAVLFSNSWVQYKKDNPQLQASSSPLLKKSIKQLQEYFDGARKEFDLPLAPEGTPFQQKAWKALLKIPYGKTASYFDQAVKIGNSKAVRAVGGANGKNPIPVIIPCHRVIGKNGDLVGFSSGLPIKKKLLALENNQETL